MEDFANTLLFILNYFFLIFIKKKNLAAIYLTIYYILQAPGKYWHFDIFHLPSFGSVCRTWQHKITKKTSFCFCKFEREMVNKHALSTLTLVDSIWIDFIIALPSAKNSKFHVICFVILTGWKFQNSKYNSSKFSNYRILSE